MNRPNMLLPPSHPIAWWAAVLCTALLSGYVHVVLPPAARVGTLIEPLPLSTLPAF